jgi:hypothetical protein
VILPYTLSEFSFPTILIASLYDARWQRRILYVLCFALDAALKNGKVFGLFPIFVSYRKSPDLIVLIFA